MKLGLKSVLILFSVIFVFGSVSVDEAAAQGPIIKRLRELNGGKPILPFVSDSEPERPSKKKEPTPASKSKSKSDAKKPTPASKSKSGKGPTPADPRDRSKNTKIKLESPDKPAAPDQSTAAKGFGMTIAESGEKFIIKRIDPRGNAAKAGLKRGDVIVNIGGAPIQVVEEYEAIGKAMKGGDRVEFEVSRRGGKPEKLNLQFGEVPPADEIEEEPNKIEVAPKLDPTPAVRPRTRYEPEIGSGLKSVYERSNKPSSVYEPTPARKPVKNGVKSLEELDFPALGEGN